MIEVDAVKTPELITAIEQNLKSKGDIYSDVWKFGLNTAMRIQDLLAIEYSKLDLDKKEYSLIEMKTNKTRTITLNNGALAVINRRREQYPDDKFLFQSHSHKLKRNVKKPVSRVTVSRVFKSVGDKLDLHINTHSMRKTRGYMMFKDGRTLEHICKMLNHSHPAITMAYIGIGKEDIAKSYEEYVL